MTCSTSKLDQRKDPGKNRESEEIKERRTIYYHLSSSHNCALATRSTALATRSTASHVTGACHRHQFRPSNTEESQSRAKSLCTPATLESSRPDPQPTRYRVTSDPCFKKSNFYGLLVPCKKVGYFEKCRSSFTCPKIEMLETIMIL